MIKYAEYAVTFEEIPDEVTLAINISNCQHHCKGCHSPYLREDIGEELTYDVLEDMINKNDGITCVCFMGEGNDIDEIYRLGIYVKNETNLKVGIYSGSEDVPDKFWELFDYIKLGGYKEEYGPLNKSTTNQRLYMRMDTIGWVDITHKFWSRQ